MMNSHSCSRSASIKFWQEFTNQVVTKLALCCDIRSYMYFWNKFETCIDQQTMSGPPRSKLPSVLQCRSVLKIHMFLLNLHIRMLYAQRAGLYFYTRALNFTTLLKIIKNATTLMNTCVHLTVKSVISSFAINSGNYHQTCDGTVLQQLNFSRWPAVSLHMIRTMTVWQEIWSCALFIGSFERFDWIL